MDFKLKLEGLRERRNDYLFEPFLYSWKVELRPNLWSIIVLKYLIMIITDKFMRGLLHVILEQVRMDLNHIYSVNEDGNVVISSLMKHTIVRVVIVAVRVEKIEILRSY